jgi:hypothetical protein
MGLAASSAMRTTEGQRLVKPRSHYLGLLLVAAILGACSNPDDDFRAAEQAGTETGWRQFIQQHPDSALAGQARLQLDNLLEQQDWAKAQASQSADALRAYLQAHPMGPNADTALEQLLDLERRFVWQTAERAASREAYENFLLQYPDAPEADEARKRIAALSPTVAAKPDKPAAVKPAATKAPATAARSGNAPKTNAGNTRLQFGAFSTRERALEQRQLLQSRFSQLLPGNLSVDAPGAGSRDQLYRLRSTPMSEAQARSTCAALKEKGQACMVVP